MVNPTGYTALDLIGFTDRGTYSSSDNYVKNDLVHYSGNIWRCLIDDTSGITPSEGVNWTLFIGEPTNLVERIIAPVETDPATNSYAVGRQFIYNDNLYEVIAAITAGDALVAYEDDPTNANIKLADPVETQLLNEESTRAAADLALRNSLTNRNLLDNAWFTVNQRGFTSGSDLDYTVDRWKNNIGNYTVSLSNNIITLTKDNDTTESEFVQYFERSVLEDCIGKTLTLSVMTSDGNVYHASGVMPTLTSTLQNFISFSIGNFIVSCGVRNTNNDLVRLRSTTANDTISIKAFKLELGSISTLAMDTAPNYAEELLKCQRYYQKYATYTTTGFISSSGLRYYMPIYSPIKMRVNPSAKMTGWYGRIPSGGYCNHTSATITAPTALNVVYSDSLQNMCVQDTVTTAVDTNNIIVGYHIEGLELSADL